MRNERLYAAGSLSVAACAVVVAASVAGAAPSSPEAANQVISKIEQYCAQSFRRADIRRDDWPDCTQEVFARLLDRVGNGGLEPAIADGESAERQELKRSVWRAVKRYRRHQRPAIHQVDSLVDSADGPEQVCMQQEAAETALDRIAGRQREIIELWSEGWSVAQIAEELKLDPPRVSDEKYKAIRKIRAATSLADA